MGYNDTLQQAAEKTSANTLSQRDEAFKNVEVLRSKDSKQIILPEGMKLVDGIKWLQRKAEEEEMVIAVSEEIEAYVMDGAFAFARAIAQEYGFGSLTPTPSFFGSRPPQMISMCVGVKPDGTDETVQVPWGRIQIPGIEGWLSTGFTMREGRWIFRIVGEIKQKNRGHVVKLAEATRQLIRESSVYRGKAIRVKFPNIAEGEDFDINDSPKFMDVSKVDETELLFNEDILVKIRNAVFNPIEKTRLAREHGVPLKTGVLLAGPYGTGKTMTANHTAAKCVRNQWTFIYLDDVRQLKQALIFAQQYAPAVVFAEDIDRAMSGGRTPEIDAILNTIDGVDTKHGEVEVVLTTNHLENINQAMLRPGRLDAVIEVSPPNAKTAEKLVRLYGRGLIDQNADLREIGELLNGHIPAFIRQVVESSKRAALTYLQPGERMHLTVEALKESAIQMRDHAALLAPKPEDKREPLEKLGHALGHELVRGFVRAGVSPSFDAAMKHLAEEEHAHKNVKPTVPTAG